MNQHNFEIDDYNKPFILQRADPYMYISTQTEPITLRHLCQSMTGLFCGVLRP